MHLISIAKLRLHAAKYPDVKGQIESWYRVVKASRWKNLADVQQFYKTAEAVGNFTVFNIKGNAYRLIVAIDYETEVVYYKYFLTHADYNKNIWKNDPYF